MPFLLLSPAAQEVTHAQQTAREAFHDRMSECKTMRSLPRGGPGRTRMQALDRPNGMNRCPTRCVDVDVTPNFS